MLNIFPDLLNYALLAPFILRVALGLIFIDLGALKFRSEKQRWLTSFDILGLRPVTLFVPLYALLQIVGGVLLIIGLWTQLAALVFVIFTGIELYVEWSAREVLKRDMVFYLLLFIISVSILLTGAGTYALDIPL
ncbi:MAG: DoxX family protein [Candidatus Zambryskibacteria bacterium]|nr:DoxX family protein [Candidatus Zambryskibacteria bacterium]